MSVSSDTNGLAEETNEKLSLHDPEHHDTPLNETSTGQSLMICTGDSCSIPLNASHNGTSLANEKTSESEDQSEGVSDPATASNKQTKKTKRKNKNKGGGNRQSESFIQQIHTQSDLNKVLQQHDTVLLEFVTTWCGTCHGIQPLYEELAQSELGISANNEGGTMLRATQVVCDKNKETKKLADANGVGSYPVFVVYQNGKEVTKWNGADIGKLEKAFDNYGGGSGGKRGKGGKGKKGKGRR